ncbi:thaumatin-like protein 1 [Pyrus x bretschneideri]|uniref:thaumatin-like protein 1 n=1 Tax=Pyrus x bretschneideri TaxID=225117 RepID=UPI0008708175|nr:thaumatin-like protein 1 [Pyrus x bretschneideri]
MASHQVFSSFLFLLCLLQSIKVGYPATFTIANKCTTTIWPAILSNGGTDQRPATTGFALPPGESNTFSVPTSWSGRLWGRTLCSQDSTTGNFSCLTGDCGSSAVECAGRGAAPPATFAEFTLNGTGGLDFYDVSLVDGYNLPMLVVAEGGTGGNCTTTGCVVDLNNGCPSELKVTASGEGVACKSACETFGEPQYCCSGPYATPDTCMPSSYSQFFKTGCPKAYSYAYDDGTGTITCASANYIITFCPAPSISVKSSNGTVAGTVGVSASLRSTTPNIVVFAVTIMAAAWLGCRDFESM